MQFLLVTIVLESSLTELESSAIAFLLVTIQLESSTRAPLFEVRRVRYILNKEI